MVDRSSEILKVVLHQEITAKKKGGKHKKTKNPLVQAPVQFGRLRRGIREGHGFGKIKTNQEPLNRLKQGPMNISSDLAVWKSVRVSSPKWEGAVAVVIGCEARNDD